jgi:hypothetical protein
MTLILAQARPDLSADSILSEVLRIRSRAWPNLPIIELGDALLGRNDGFGLSLKSSSETMAEDVRWTRR